jgi:hypothetical protein
LNFEGILTPAAAIDRPRQARRPSGRAVPPAVVPAR